MERSLAAGHAGLGAAGSGGADEESFDALGVAIARFQAERVPEMGRLLRARGVDPRGLHRAADIPALPCELFRLRRIAAHPAAQDERVFRTSGTTAGPAGRGAHAMRTTATYALAALRWGERMLWPERGRLGFMGLVLPEAQAPDSSLSFMLARFAERLDPRASWHWDGRKLDVEAVARACRGARDRGEPALVAGTAFALAELLAKGGRDDLRLPQGSRVMYTGGFKGHTREIEPSELRRRLAEAFGLAPAFVVGEYGMTELASQLYERLLRDAVEGRPDAGAAGRYYPPPWLRAEAVDPVRLEPLFAGEEGLCRLVDLGNVDSAVCILTEDLVRAFPDGSVELRGRQRGAPARGCSLAIEEALGGAAEPAGAGVPW
ncbi:MAG: acyl-protein synthetase [Deltaproteobacteria bacterium]|nr:acyl-protein synthetase [Deltaproteobacteria bacterium]